MQITNLANKVNELNKGIVKKKLRSVKTGAPVKLLDTHSVGGNVKFTIDAIKDYLLAGHNLYDIGVIARTKAELQELNIALQKEKIPCIVSVHEYLKDNPKVKNIIDFIQYLQDKEKTLFLAEFLQAKNVKEFEKQTNLEKYIAIANEQIQKDIESMTEPELIEYFFEQLDFIVDDDRALAELITILKDKTFTSLNGISKFLSKIREYDADFGIEKDEEAYDAITLMTAHSAKGREYPIIIVMLDKFANNDEEDNRCAFVSVTRAMEELIMIQDVTYTETSRTKYKYYDTIKELLKN